MIDLDKLTKEQLETLIECGLEQEIADLVYREEPGVCAVSAPSTETRCVRAKDHSGCHIATGAAEVFEVWNPTPEPVGVPRGLAISIAQALLTAAENMPEYIEIQGDNWYDFAEKLLVFHPEREVSRWHWGEIVNIEAGDYGTR